MKTDDLDRRPGYDNRGKDLFIAPDYTEVTIIPTPSPMNRGLAKRSNPHWIFRLSLRVSANDDAPVATIRHQIVPVQKKVNPKKRDGRGP